MAYVLLIMVVSFRRTPVWLLASPFICDYLSNLICWQAVRELASGKAKQKKVGCKQVVAIFSFMAFTLAAVGTCPYQHFKVFVPIQFKLNFIPSPKGSLLMKNKSGNNEPKN